MSALRRLGFTELDTLAGKDSWARNINATGE
jgi:hypothetical protein